MIPFRKCSSCNKSLAPGSTKYSVHIDVTSDFDGFLPEEDVGSIETLMEDIEQLSADELDSDVHIEIELSLCVECKKRLMEQVGEYTDAAPIVRQKQRANLH
jgi:uncharacterized protein with PIN domain